MATIRASCAECGDVELTTTDVTVRVCTGDNQGAYSFRCPSCRMIVVKQAESATIDLLDFHRALHDDGEFRAALASLAA